MNFKADWSFLDKISMGAIASRKIVEMLNLAGHDVIELERYSTSNKIWATKIKRLRLPDLICLKCGKRIESRAKSNLDIRMSDNENNPDRRWNAGLRDEDLIAFIRCQKTESGWVPAEQINLFETASLRESITTSKLGNPKSPGEGAERDRIWPSSIPKKNGMVLEVDELSDGLQIKVEYLDGKKYTYSTKKDKMYHAYCKAGDSFVSNETMIAGTALKKESVCNCTGHYDFLSDLDNGQEEVRYAGVKALGYLKKKQIFVDKLKKLQTIETDKRISLEIFSSLIRLGEDVWNDFENFALSLDEKQYRFEYVLIMSELSSYPEAANRLYRIVKDTSLDEEMRSAAAWGLRVDKSTLQILFEITKVGEDNIASHAIAHIIENYKDEFTKYLFEFVIDDISGGIALKIVTEAATLAPSTLIEVYQNLTTEIQKKWCAMTIGLLGSEQFLPYKTVIEHFDPEKYQMIVNLWDYSKAMVSPYKSSEIEFLRKQSM